VTRSIHVIGNIQMDVLASPVVKLPEPGGDDIIDSIALRPAGAAGNVSLALAALGAPHRLFGAVGDDQAGRWVLDELHRLGLGGDVLVVAGQDTGISIAVEAPTRERAFITAHGVLERYGAVDVPEEALAGDLVLVTGYFSMPGLRREGTRELLTRAHELGARTFLDTGWDPDDWTGDAAAELRELLPLVDVFLPNQGEALALTGCADTGRAAVELAATCREWAVVKDGPNGVTARSRDGDEVDVPAPAVEALDTTGAGDTLAAGLLADLAEGRPFADALMTGVRVASTVVGRPSRNRYPTRDELLPVEMRRLPGDQVAFHRRT
jgi:sugar/nucleoside kinase (ribokinase family)